MNLEARARLSGGTSLESIYCSAAAKLAALDAAGRLVDVGCGAGQFITLAADRFRCIGVDAVAYERFPQGCPLVLADLERGIPLRSGLADVVVSLETIEHLENPWAFVRELARVVRPGGWIVISTPNQLSALSLLTLLTRRRFASFQDVHYPAHRTALLESDLRRMAADAGLDRVEVSYTLAGRIPFLARHYPVAMARMSPRLFSDTVMLAAHRRATP